MTRMGKLRHVFNAAISFRLKMRIYTSAICSLFTYGSETWIMDKAAMAKLNGANARCLSRFSGKSPHQEASAYTRSYDLVSAVQSRRRKWLGHLLRLKGNRLVKLATAVQHGQQAAGNLFQGIPPQLTYQQVHALAQDRDGWRALPT